MIRSEMFEDSLSYKAQIHGSDESERDCREIQGSKLIKKSKIRN